MKYPKRIKEHFNMRKGIQNILVTTLGFKQPAPPVEPEVPVEPELPPSFCVGATSSIVLSTSGENPDALDEWSHTHYETNYAVKVECLDSKGQFVSHTANSDNALSLVADWEGLVTIPTPLGNVLFYADPASSSWNGDVEVTFKRASEEVSPVHITLIPPSDLSKANFFSIAGDNPTGKFVSRTEEITFCLVPKGQCDGATTSAWFTTRGQKDSEGYVMVHYDVYHAIKIKDEIFNADFSQNILALGGVIPFSEGVTVLLDDDLGHSSGQGEVLLRVRRNDGSTNPVHLQLLPPPDESLQHIFNVLDGPSNGGWSQMYDAYPNPTVVFNGRAEPVNMCIAPSPRCYGATDTATLYTTYNDGFSYEVFHALEIDGQLFNADNSLNLLSPANMPVVTSTGIAVDITTGGYQSSDWNGEFVFNASCLDEPPKEKVHIKLIPPSDPSKCLIGWGENSNPTMSFDETTQEGDFCLNVLVAVEPPPDIDHISCVGATDTLFFQVGYATTRYYVLNINGVDYIPGGWSNESVLGLGGHVFRITHEQLTPDDRNFFDFKRLTLVSTEHPEQLPLRVKLSHSDWESGDIVGVGGEGFSSENPTAIFSPTEQAIYACFNKARSLSCVGATDIAAISVRDTNPDEWGSYPFYYDVYHSLEVDGEVYNSDNMSNLLNGEPIHLTNGITLRFLADTGSSSWDARVYIEAERDAGSEPIKIKMIPPVNAEKHVFGFDSVINPTGIYDSDTQELQFCLLPKEADIGDVLPEAEFAVIRYTHEASSGYHLNTRTWSVQADGTTKKIGWGTDDGERTPSMKWVGFPSLFREQSVLVNLTELKKQQPDQSLIEIDMAAFWYYHWTDQQASVGTGNIEILVDTYRGGMMVANPENSYSWINEGGVSVQSFRLPSNVMLVDNRRETIGENIGKITFDTTTNRFYLDGVGGMVSEELLSPAQGLIAPGRLPMKWTVTNLKTGEGEAPFKTTLFGTNMYSIVWELRRNGEVIANSEGYMGGGVLISGNGLGTYIDTAHPYASNGVKSPRDVNHYEFWGDFNYGDNDKVTLSYKSDGTGPHEIEFEVTQFSTTLKQPVFPLGNLARLIMPATLPPYIKSLRSMLAESDLTHTDLTGWDMSNITDATGLFKKATFNQDISMWDMSNVNSTASMFERTKLFNQDISMWDMSNVTNMSSMFSYNKWFNQDIGYWDVSNVQDMTALFCGSTVFNQDLSGWNVVKQPSRPTLFDSDTIAWVLPKPIWGTDGSGGSKPPKPVITPMLFNVTRNSDDSTTLDVNITTTKFKLRDAVTGALLADATQTYDEARVYSYSSGSFEILCPNIGTEQFALYFEDPNAANTLVFDQEIGESTIFLDVLDFSNMAKVVKFEMGGNPFKVPSTLPPQMTNLSYMFADATAFNQDLSGWNVSKVTDFGNMFDGCYAFNGNVSTWDTSSALSFSEMFNDCPKFNQDISGWNVGTVTNMYSMFYQCGSFNQDLSAWDVRNIPSEPNYFKSSTTAWTKPKPVWGTVGKYQLTRFLAADLSGAAGYMVTISKNGGEFVTYNLADPSFDAKAFQLQLAAATTPGTIAFYNYPSVIGLESPEVAGALYGGIGSITISGKLVTPNSPNGYNQTEGIYIGEGPAGEIVVTPPYHVVRETTTLTIVPTPDAPPGADIYTSLNVPADYSGVRLVSNAAIAFM